MSFLTNGPQIVSHLSPLNRCMGINGYTVRCGEFLSHKKIDISGKITIFKSGRLTGGRRASFVTGCCYWCLHLTNEGIALWLYLLIEILLSGYCAQIQLSE